MTYPYDWEFVPSTLGEDGDPLDGLVIHQSATAPGIAIKCDLLGALSVKQNDQDKEIMRNDRYVFAPHKEDAPSDPVAADCVPDRLRDEIEQFFLSSVLGTGTTLKFLGRQDVCGWHSQSGVRRVGGRNSSSAMSCWRVAGDR